MLYASILNEGERNLRDLSVTLRLTLVVSFFSGFEFSGTVAQPPARQNINAPVATTKVLRQKIKGVSSKQLSACATITSSVMLELYINRILKFRLHFIIITSAGSILKVHQVHSSKQHFIQEKQSCSFTIHTMITIYYRGIKINVTLFFTQQLFQAQAMSEVRKQASIFHLRIIIPNINLLQGGEAPDQCSSLQRQTVPHKIWSTFKS